jgi:hypothetical protein
MKYIAVNAGLQEPQMKSYDGDKYIRPSDMQRAINCIDRRELNFSLDVELFGSLGLSSAAPWGTMYWSVLIS